jgi:DNA-binding MarR family transcriptional regulator
MTLEKEIQQQHSFRSERHKLMVNVIYSSNWINEKLKNFLEQEDITSQQYNILRILRGSHVPLSTLQIRERMIDRMSDTSRIVDRLVIKGLIDKKTSATDKRLVDIVINKKGKDVLARLDARNDELDRFVEHLSDDEALIINRLLDKMREV